MKKPVKKNNVVLLREKQWIIEKDIPLPERKRGGGQYYPIQDLKQPEWSFWQVADENTEESAIKMSKRIYAWYRGQRAKGEFSNTFITGAAEVNGGKWGARIWRTA